MSNIPEKKAGVMFTQPQWNAIYDSGTNILVSASAGSGKTRVLVERVIEKLKAGTKIDELLIVTFTEAAAREMKERIQKELRQSINQETISAAEKQLLTEQLVKLPTANISTLHAFCLTVIRRFYYLIDLDPVFRMLTDETETLLLKEDVWEELRENLYDDEDGNAQGFYELTSNFSNDRNDDGLTDLVYRLYDFARANPDPQQWLVKLLDNYPETGGLAKSALFQNEMLPLMQEIVAVEVENYRQLVKWAASTDGLEKVLLVVETEGQLCENLLNALNEKNYQKVYDLLNSPDLSLRYPSIRKEELKEISSEIKIIRDQAKDNLKNLKNIFLPEPPAVIDELIGRSRPLIQELIRVGQAFMENYAKAKEQKGVLDFNDLEHFTLAILNSDNDEGVREASQYYRKKFKEVLVDEYQDTNGLQEAIISQLTNPQNLPGNLFMVGDVKQSIYSFRLADPTLFISKYEAFQADNQQGRLIVLPDNFRSRHEVIDFTNLIFEQLMDKQVGQITYDADAKLVAGFGDFPESEHFNTEILLYQKEKTSIDDLDELFENPSQIEELVLEDKTDGELLMTGLKIRQLVDDGFKIYDKESKQERPVAYGDIVLLTPTKKNNIAIVDLFERLGIPVEVNDAQNFFQATEVRTMISLLQIIDNPYQDIPLAAILRSPIVGLNEQDLATLRVANKKGSFYEAVRSYQAEDKLFEKVTSFLTQLNQWREQVRRRNLAQLIWQIYDETGYPEYVLGLPAGDQRYANLLALAERAKSYESSSYRGLYQFIRFIEKMQEKDKDLAEPVTQGNENAVRVMTIHASKGLEFPIVFVMDMAKRFNMSDTKANYIFDEKAGIGIRYMDQLLRVKKMTLPYIGIRQLKTRKLLSEEMRKLYVALTRAEQKLFLVGSYASQEDLLKNWGAVNQEERELVIPANLRLQTSRSLLDWVGWSLMRHPDMKKFSEEAVSLAQLTKHPSHFKIDWFTDDKLQADFQELSVTDETVEVETVSAEKSKEFLASAKRMLDFSYPFEAATNTTSYQSVSEIKRIFDDPDNLGSEKLVWESNQQKAMKKNRYVVDDLAVPEFITLEKKPTAAAIGTATHRILQLVSLEKKPTLAELENLSQRLVDAGNFDEAVAEAINLENILRFFETDLGELLVENYPRVKREQPFAMLRHAAEIFADFPEGSDEILIHGIIDGYIIFEDQIILYDLKTDYVKNPDDEAEINAIVQRYQGQLRLYQNALAKAENLPVTKVFLVLLAAGKVIEMN